MSGTSGESGAERPARFEGSSLVGATFERVDLTGASFTACDLTGATLRGLDLVGVRMRGVEIEDVEITGEVRGLVVNGVDVGPLVEAELDRRDPERRLVRASTAEGMREAWSMLERRWEETVARARALDPALLHVSVEGEWSFVETLRHLVFATDSWVGRCLLGDPAPWHPLSLPWDQMPDMDGVPRDRSVRPSLDEVLVVRADRQALVRDVLARLTDEALAAETEPVEGPGWPPPRPFPVAQVLGIVLNEEWEHRRYAERDLAALTAQ